MPIAERQAWMPKNTRNEFRSNAAQAPLNGWTEKEKEWLRMIGMTEDKPTDPQDLEAYWDREYRAYQRWRRTPHDEQYKILIDRAQTLEL
jgi:hypothetical protein